MSSLLIEVLKCDCNPNFIYKTKQSYNNHYKSERHLKWQRQYNEQNYRKKIIELENTISSLKLENIMWKDMAIQLKQRYEPYNLLD